MLSIFENSFLCCSENVKDFNSFILGDHKAELAMTERALNKPEPAGPETQQSALSGDFSFPWQPSVRAEFSQQVSGLIHIF